MTSGDASYKMWGGRFREALDPELLEFTSSLPEDRRLLRWDLLASIAHVVMLGETGIIPATDAREIAEGLRGLLADVDAGRLSAEGPFEDVHSFVEATLFQRIGQAAGRLHTARSRNDQVATAFRLYMREQLVTVVKLIRDLMETAINRAAATVNVVIPGFTHLQHAQPVRLAHHLLGYVWMLDRDADRMMASYRRTDVLPLGSGALAGVSFPVDRQRVAKALGFSTISENSIDATGDRDFALDAVFAVAVVMIHLSRWSGELVLWASEEFGFVQLADAVATGSSLMPQKKNPDPAELIRARAGRVLGALVALLATLKGLPAGYQRDLQEDKASVFEAFDITVASLRAMLRLLDGVEFVGHRMEAAARQGLLTATEVADYLVKKGVAFREAHRLAGQVVQSALQRGVQLWDLPFEEYHSVSLLFDEDVLKAVGIEASIEAKRVPGGTARQSVEDQLVAARTRLTALATWLSETSSALGSIEALAQR